MIAVVLVVQHTLLDSVRVDGAHPDVMLLLPVAAGYAAGPDRGAVFGFITGLVADLFLPTPFGLSALVGCLLGFGTGLATRGLVRSSWWLPPVVAAAATAAGMGAYAILGAVLGDPAMLRTYLVARPRGRDALGGRVLAVPVLRFVAWAVPEPGPAAPRAAGRGPAVKFRRRRFAAGAAQRRHPRSARPARPAHVAGRLRHPLRGTHFYPKPKTPRPARPQEPTGPRMRPRRSVVDRVMAPSEPSAPRTVIRLRVLGRRRRRAVLAHVHPAVVPPGPRHLGVLEDGDRQPGPRRSRSPRPVGSSPTATTASSWATR